MRVSRDWSLTMFMLFRLMIVGQAWHADASKMIRRRVSRFDAMLSALLTHYMTPKLQRDCAAVISLSRLTAFLSQPFTAPFSTAKAVIRRKQQHTLQRHFTLLCSTLFRFDYFTMLPTRA